MSKNNDTWGFEEVMPWVLVVGGLIVIPMLWPLGALMLAAGVAWIARATK